MTKTEKILKDCETREAELNAELEEIKKRNEESRSEAEVTADAERVSAIEKELAEVKENREKAKKEAEAVNAVNNGGGEPVEDRKEDTKIMDKNTKEYRSTKEYRDAFAAYLRGAATPEQRDALITTGTAGIELPAEMDTQIWDNIHNAHPILADIDTEETGIILEVVKHTAATKGKAKKVAEGEKNDDEDNTFVKVQLVGNDYAKDVELSYAVAKMTEGTLESYLATEIAADIGEALASDVFAQIKADLGAAAVTVAASKKLTYADLMTAFGAAEHADSLVVYGNSARIYGELYGMVDNNGQPVIRDGVALGADVKVDSAAGNDIYVVDPKKFILNVVQPMMVETDRDIKAHKIVISGYTRAQGTMRDTKAGAYIGKATS